MLLLLMLLPLLQAGDVAKSSKHVTRKISSCPDVGYFFKREILPNSVGPGRCELCFCHDDGTALCWQRENRRCDHTSYKHNLRKRDTRERRSPLGLSDIFLRDAARDVFNKNSPPACKPYETSFGDGCPPADWCIGCTVCDCDPHGRWDCHHLSFCPEKDNKSRMLAFKKPTNKHKIRGLKITPTKTTLRTPKTTLAPKKTQMAKSKRQSILPSSAQIITSVTSKKPLLIKKDMSTRKPLIFGSNAKIVMNSTIKEAFTQEVVRRVVAVMQDVYNKTLISNLQSQPCPKVVQKRSMDKKKKVNSYKPQNFKKLRIPSKNKKPYNKTVINNKKGQDKRVKANRKPTTRKPRKNLKSKEIRRKRGVEKVGINEVSNSIDSNFSKADIISSAENKIFDSLLTTNDYYRYTLVRQEGDDTVTKSEPYQVLNNRTHQESIAKTETIPVLTFKPNEKKLVHSAESKDNIVNTYLMDKLNSANDSSKTAELYTPLAQLVGENKNDSYNFRRLMNMRTVNDSKTLTPSWYRTRITDNVNITEYDIKSHLVKKINDIQTVLRRLFGEFRKNNTKATKPKRKKVNILKYLKKFFKKFFRKGKAGLTNKAYSKRRFKNYIVNTICNIFESCDKNQSTNKFLDTKVIELKSVSDDLLRNIKIIKGLLHLIDFENITYNETLKKFKNDIHKLNFILNGQYQRNNVTQNQMTQIGYIKDNSQIFIKQVGKFVTVLNDIVTILTKKGGQDLISKDEVLINNMDEINQSVSKDFYKLKKLLLKYNLVQNKFMRKMYLTLNNFENNEIMTKVSGQYEKELRATVAIERFSRAIINNLRKLKILAETLNSKTRVKRQTMRDDDNIEYLLTLMEFMLKQNYPLDVAPVNDGIDLLIEAIKNAPDVKPIPKKALYFKPLKTRISRTTEAPPYNVSKYDSSVSANEDSKQVNKSSVRGSESMSDTAEQNDPGKIEVPQYQAVKNIIDENTEYTFHTVEPPTTLASQITLDIPTTDPIDIRNIYKYHPDTLLDKFVKEDTDKKFDVFSQDADDYDSNVYITVTTTPMDTETETESVAITSVPEETTELKLAEVKKYIYNNDDVSASITAEKKAGLDWFDEGQDDTKEAIQREVNETFTQAPPPFIPLTTSRTVLQKNMDTISGLSREINEEVEKKMLQKLKSDDLLRKKHKDFLNSLDYAEKTESDDDKEEIFPSLYYS